VSKVPANAGAAKPLVQKLGIQPGFRIFVAGAPGPYEGIVGKLPEAARLVTRPGKQFDMIHLFAATRTALIKDLAFWRKAIAPDGMIWVSWPKRASGVPTDLTDNAVRELALPLGLVDVKVSAIDATWSALKFVIRRELRSQTERS
jgi:hypothetical protein